MSKSKQKVNRDNFIPYPNNLAKMNYTKRSVFFANADEITVINQEIDTEHKSLIAENELDNKAINRLTKKFFTTLDIDYIIKQFIANYINAFTPDKILEKQKDDTGNIKIIHCIEKPTGGNNYYTLCFYYEDIFTYGCHKNPAPATMRYVASTFRDFICKETETKRIFESVSRKGTYFYTIPYYSEAEFALEEYKIAGEEKIIKSFKGGIIRLHVHQELINGILNEKGYNKKNFYYGDKFFATKSWEFIDKARNIELQKVRNELIEKGILKKRAGLLQTKIAIKQFLEKERDEYIKRIDSVSFLYWQALNNLESYLPIHISKENETGKLLVNDREFSTLINGNYIHKVDGKLQFKSKCKREFYELCNKRIFPIFPELRSLKEQFAGLQYIPIELKEMSLEEQKEQRKQGSNKNAILFWQREF